MAIPGVFLLALAMVYLMPGPDMILLLQTGARQGRGAALATALGLAIARSCHVALAALGLATLFKISPWTFDVARVAGAAYLLWMGVQLFSARAFSLVSAGSTPQTGSWSAAMQRGVLTNLLNPKALLFCSVLLPQFITPHAESVTMQFTMLGVVLVAAGFMFDTGYALAGTWVGHWLERNPKVQRLQQWLFGGLLIGFATRLMFMRQT